MGGWVPSDRPTRIGVVGLGRIYDLTILAYRGWPNAEIVALCDLDEAKLAERGDEFPDATRYVSLDRLLEHDMDMVEVLVPSPHHCRVVCQVLDAGFHVNVQKPMAGSLDEADRMIAARDRAGVQLRVMENYHFYPPLIRLKEIVESGEIGEPVGFHMKMVGTGLGGWDVPAETWIWQMEDAANGHGIFVYDDGWHKFSVARWLFGPVREVSGWIGLTDLGGGYCLDAPTTISWEHDSGLRGVFDATLAPDQLMKSDYYSNDERFEVTGKRGFVRVNHCTAHGLRQPTLEVYRDGELRQYHALDDDWATSFRDSGRHFVTALRDGTDYLWNAEDARDVLGFLMASVESSKQNRRVRLGDAQPE
jgi:predicted dehydrogenase